MNKAYKTLLAGVLAIVLSGPALGQVYRPAGHVDDLSAPATAVKASRPLACEKPVFMYPEGNEAEPEPR